MTELTSLPAPAGSQLHALKFHAFDSAAPHGNYAVDMNDVLAASAVGIYPEATAQVPKGLLRDEDAVLTPGSGGTDGVFEATWTGGNFTVNPKGRFKVRNGRIDWFVIDGPGLCVNASPSAPTASLSASTGLTGASVPFRIEALVDAGATYWADHATDATLWQLYRNAAGAVAALSGRTQPKNMTSAVSTIGAQLDGAGWLKAEALSMAWTSQQIGIAKAIKYARMEGAGIDPAQTYYISVFCKSDASFNDRIVIARTSDNAAVTAVASPTYLKAAGGITEVVLSGTNIEITLGVAFDEITTTGILLNSATATPLQISHSASRAAVRLARRGRGLVRNIALDPAGASASGVYQAVGTLPAQASANAALAALGVVRSHSVGTGTTATALWKREQLPANSGGRWFNGGALVYSASGAHWPDALPLYAYNVVTGGSPISGLQRVLSDYVQITTDVRWYFVRAILPAGTASVAYGLDSMVSGSAAEIGGWCAAVTEDPLDLHSLPRRDWTGWSTRDSWRDGIDTQLATTTALASGFALAFTNRWSNGAFDPLLPLHSTVGATPVYAAPASPAFLARSVQQVFRVGAGGSTGGMYISQNDVLFAGDVGLNYISALLAYSSDGATWPSLSTFFYDSAGQNGSGAGMASFVTIDANNRLYYATGTVPAPRSGNTFSGMVRSGINTNLSGSAASIEISGAYFAVSATAINAATVAQNDFWPRDLTKPRMAAAARNNPTARFAGKRIVFLGDSIIDEYGVPEAVCATLGATCFNFAWGGSRMTTGAPGNFAALGVCAIANSATADDFTALVAAAAAQYPSGSAYDVRKRDKAAAIAAFDWATVDYFVIGAGTNDWSASVSLGAATSTTTTQFNGAINETVRQFQLLSPHAQFLMLTPAWRGPGATYGDSDINANPSSVMLSAFGAAIVERGENRWHYPICDMRRALGINPSNNATYLADDLHPTAVAGRDRWASVISRSALEQLA